MNPEVERRLDLFAHRLEALSRELAEIRRLAEGERVAQLRPLESRPGRNRPRARRLPPVSGSGRARTASEAFVVGPGDRFGPTSSAPRGSRGPAGS